MAGEDRLSARHHSPVINLVSELGQLVLRAGNWNKTGYMYTVHMYGKLVMKRSNSAVLYVALSGAQGVSLSLCITKC